MYKLVFKIRHGKNRRVFRPTAFCKTLLRSQNTVEKRINLFAPVITSITLVLTASRPTLLISCTSFPYLLNLYNNNIFKSNYSHYIARVAHTVATNHGLSVGLPGPIHLSLMLQTFAPRYATSYILSLTTLYVHIYNKLSFYYCDYCLIKVLCYHYT